MSATYTVLVTVTAESVQAAVQEISKTLHWHINRVVAVPVSVKAMP